MAVSVRISAIREMLIRTMLIRTMLIRTMMIRTMMMGAAALGLIAFATPAAAQEARADSARPHTASPNVAVVDTAFAMPQLGRTRRIWVYLPPGYAASDRRYPVLYMHDGQNVFDAATSYAGEWGVDEALDSLAAAGDPGIIVVAIDNGPERIAEYSPWTHPRAGGGQGDAYVDFLANTLKPWVDARYRTRPGPQHTGIMGSSMGGLISLAAAFRMPDVFGQIGVFSPSLWFSDSAFVAARESRPSGVRPRFYFVSGGGEGSPEEPRVVVRGQERMVSVLD